MKKFCGKLRVPFDLNEKFQFRIKTKMESTNSKIRRTDFSEAEGNGMRVFCL